MEYTKHIDHPEQPQDIPGVVTKAIMENKKPSNPQNALAIQEGGSHYKSMKIQPMEYIHANGIGFAEGNVIKYVSRWKNKNGLQDLKKARHTLDLLIQLEESKKEF